MMRLGIPTLVEVGTVEELAALCSSLGFSFVELNTNFPQHQLHLLDPEALNRLAEQYGIQYTIHLNDDLPVADFNPAVAAGYRQAVLEAIAFAKKIHAPVLNIHMAEGARYTMPDRRIFFYEAYSRQYLEGMETFRDLCTQAVADSDIHICVENSGPYLQVHKRAIDMLLESPVFGLTMDIGHNYCAGSVDEEWILARRNRLLHMHIHDAADGKRDHLPLGTGTLDIAKYLALAEENACTAVIEIKTLAGLQQSAAWLKNR